MAIYTITGVGPAANTTAATAGIVKVESGSSPRVPSIKRWAVTPNSNSANNNYTVRLKRQTTAGTWTAATPAANEGANAAAANAVGGINSTAAGSASTVLADFGFNSLAGFHWVAIPGGEYNVVATVSNGIIIEYLFAQGADTFVGTIEYNE